MKKLVSLLLSLALLLSCCAGLAEDLGISPDLVEIATPVLEEYPIEVMNETLSEDDGYEVTVEDSLVIVNTGTVTFQIDVPEGFLCITQDIDASIRAYRSLWPKSSESWKNSSNWMKEHNVQLELIDFLNWNKNMRIYVRFWNTDSLSEYIGNLKEVKEKNLVSVGRSMADAKNYEYNGMYVTDKNVWVCLSHNVMLTIVNGTYVACYYGFTEENMTDEELEAARSAMNESLHIVVDALAVY